MKDIQQVLRRKRSQYAQLAREIELLQAAEQTLREVAPLLADNEEEDTALLVEVEEENQSSNAMAARAGSDFSADSPSPVKPRSSVPRWP
jgi:hypothetical protein